MKHTIRTLFIFSVLFWVSLGQGGPIVNNPGCRVRDSSNKCLECSFRFYIDNQGLCQPVNPQCRTFNSISGACQSCYAGFTLVENTCLLSTAVGLSQVSDVNCFRFENGRCQECAERFFFNANRVCEQVDPNCKDFNRTNGFCTECFTGFQLNNRGQCLEAPNTVQDAGCRSFANGVCTECSQGFYFDSNRICRVIDPNCKDFNFQQRVCTGCYEGFSINSQNQCVRSSGQIISAQPLCRAFQNGVCTECVTRAFFDAQRICRAVSPNCDEYQVRNFQSRCTSCYQGFQLNTNGQCIRSVRNELDPFCNQFQNGICVRCSFRYFRNANGLCQLISPLCNEYDLVSGACRTCYLGFTLRNRQCVQNPQNVADPLCNTFQKGVCTRCSVGAFFNLQRGRCQQVNPKCRTYDQNNGNCFSCYRGASLIAGQCVQDQNLLQRDPFCSQFDENNRCLKCSVRFFFGQNRQCRPVNDLCRSFSESDGRCLSCFTGYELVTNGECRLLPVSRQTARLNCARVDSNNQCLECANRFILRAGECQMVNPLCKAYDRQGICTQCYSLFTLNTNAQCILNV